MLGVIPSMWRNVLSSMSSALCPPKWPYALEWRQIRDWSEQKNEERGERFPSSPMPLFFLRISSCFRVFAPFFSEGDSAKERVSEVKD